MQILTFNVQANTDSPDGGENDSASQHMQTIWKNRNTARH